MRQGLFALIGTTTLLASACATSAGPAAPTPSGPRSLAAVIELARADAAHRSGIAPAAITVVSAEPVTWNDGSLGCPQPSLVYTQGLVPGYRIRLRGPDANWDYHAGVRGGLVLCPPGQAVEPVPGDAAR